jgi:glycosyltransferase involved in cell wall biosynthesis
VRIMIDFSQIPLARTGAGVYAENLVREIIPLVGRSDSLFLLVQSDEIAVRDIARGKRGVRLISIPSKIFRNRALLFAFEQFLLPLLLLLLRIDLLHSLHYTHPLISPCRRVVTIHDLTFLLFPQLHTRARQLVMPRFIRNAMRRADAVIFVSQSTCRDAERLIPGGRALKAVVPLGVEPHYSISPSENEIRTTLDRLDLKSPFILNIGTLEPRKNLLRLIEAFEQLADLHPNVDLVFAGKLGWGYADVLEKIKNSSCSNRLRHVGFITDQEKLSLLNSCRIFVYPSIYEGFGLPVLEAMAAGAPVITSDNSSLSEVAGPGAVLIDPYSVSNLAAALNALLSEESKRAEMRIEGKRRASLFTWMATAQKTYQVYSSLSPRRRTRFRTRDPEAPQGLEYNMRSK